MGFWFDVISGPNNAGATSRERKPITLGRRHVNGSVAIQYPLRRYQRQLTQRRQSI